MPDDEYPPSEPVDDGAVLPVVPTDQGSGRSVAMADRYVKILVGSRRFAKGG